MDGIWQELLKFWRDSPGLAWAGLLALIVPLWLIVTNTMRGKLGEWLQSWLGAVLEPIDKAFKTQLARRFSLRAYCRLLLANESFRYLFVPGADEHDSKLDVDKAFVTLRLENASAAGPQWFDHHNLLELGNRVRVVGDPGAGKSSLVKRLLRDACEQALLAPKAAKLPILIELRRLKLPAGNDDTAALGQWLLDQLKLQVAQYSTIHKPTECFEAYFAGPGLLVLLDGLDEVASNAYPFIREALHGLSEKLATNPNNHVVLTMRSQFHQQVKNDFRDDGSHAVMVQAFTPGDIYQFLQRWPFRAKDEQAAREIRVRIYRELTERASLREMCSNPLVLAMYVAKDYGRVAGLPPSSRTRFYKQVIDELLIRRSFRQGAQVSAGTAESLREQREEILGTLALQHMLDPSQGANHLSWRAAIDLIQQKMQCDATQAATHFAELAKDTGLIVEVQAHESFRFIHLTFCEYFAALGACEWVQDGWLSVLAKHAALQTLPMDSGKNRLVEVLPFAFGLMKPMDRAERLRTLLPHADTSLLARTFLECKLYNHAAWPGFILDWKTNLQTTPETAWSEAWLAELHLFSVVVSDAKQHKSTMGGIQMLPDLEAFFTTLATQNHAGLNTLLHAYAKLDAQALFSLAELNHIDLLTDFPEVVMANCAERTFLSAILSKALADPERSAAWAALFAEAGLRATAVADQLVQLPMQKQWQARANATPKTNRWHQNSFMPDCLYTQCLSIACGPDVTSDARLTLLQVLRTMPAPGGYQLLHNGVWLPSCIGYACFAAGLALWAWLLGGFLPGDAAVICGMMALFGLATYWQKQIHTAYLFQVPSCMIGRFSIAATLLTQLEIVQICTSPRSLRWRDMQRKEIFISTVAFFGFCVVIAIEVAALLVGKPLGAEMRTTHAYLGLWLGLWLWMWLGVGLVLGLGLGQVLWKVLDFVMLILQLMLLMSWWGLLILLFMGNWQVQVFWLVLVVVAGMGMGMGMGQLHPPNINSFIPARSYWGENLATATAVLQQARSALGIRQA